MHGGSKFVIETCVVIWAHRVSRVFSGLLLPSTVPHHLLVVSLVQLYKFGARRGFSLFAFIPDAVTVVTARGFASPDAVSADIARGRAMLLNQHLLQRFSNIRQNITHVHVSI